MPYAERTDVPPDRSRVEIERTLTRYGADRFAYATSPDRAALAFEMEGKAVRFEVRVPTADEFGFTRGNTRRSPSQAQSAAEAENRRLWRCLLLCVKGKLEAVESGITTFEQEFLAHMVLPSGQTVADELVPEIDRAIDAGQMPNFTTLALPPAASSASPSTKGTRP